MLLYISATFTFAQESYTVTAKSGLTIRKEPNPDGQKLGKLPYNAVVEVIETTDFALTITDEGKQLSGNWVKVSFANIPEVSSEDTTGFVFDGYLQKGKKNTSSNTTNDGRKLELYKLSGSIETPNGKVGFVSLTDGYVFKDDDKSSLIAKEYLGEQEPKEHNYHELNDVYRGRFLKSLSIKETDSLFIYHFLSDAIISSIVSAMPVVAKTKPYRSGFPLQESDYMIGFEIGQSVFDMNVIKNFSSTTLVSVDPENPFVRGRLRPVLWEEVAASRFPMVQQVVTDSTDFMERVPNKTFEFTTADLRYFLQNRFKNGKLFARHFKVLDLKSDTLLYDKIFASGKGAALLSLNIVNNKKKNRRIAIWTGKLFKNKPPIITDLVSHSFGCPIIYFLDQSESPLEIRCDNRH